MRCLAETSTEDGLSPPVFGDEVVLGELGLHRVRLGVGLVDLVDGHDNGHLRGLGVIDGLPCLGHDPVVGGNDENRRCP